MWSLIDATMCHATCASGCFRLKALRPGKELFSPNTTADEAFLLLAGKMRYHRLLGDEEMSSGNHGPGDTAIKELAVSGNRWLAEVVLWLQWRFVGTLQAESACEFVVVEYGQLIQVIKIHSTVSETAFAWCEAFKQTLATSALDCEVEVGVPPSTIILSLPDDFRSAISGCALAVMGEGLMSRVMNGMALPMRTPDQLETEVKEGACVLAVQATGEFIRTVHVVALKLRNSVEDEKFLVQLARQAKVNSSKDELVPSWEPALQLPGKKVRIGDDRNIAVAQVVADNFPELGSFISLGRSTLTTEVKESRSYGVQTEYLRIVFEAQLRPNSSGLLAHEKSFLSFAPDTGMFAELEVHVRKCSNGKANLYAWVTEEELGHLQQQQQNMDMGTGWFPDMTRNRVIPSPSPTLKTVIQRATSDMKHKSESSTHGPGHAPVNNSPRPSGHSSELEAEVRWPSTFTTHEQLAPPPEPREQPSTAPAEQPSTFARMQSPQPPFDVEVTFNAAV
mmetsp:Transcript_17462/g.39332  ORF Transcript_17462/g.39332 Transcript_17462/m.39332 type:complete len:507 (+) Transcript_17462:3-1523(+)